MATPRNKKASNRKKTWWERLTNSDYFSFVAIVISVVSIILTIKNGDEERKRWNVINSGELVLAEATLKPFKTSIRLDELKIKQGKGTEYLTSRNQETGLFTFLTGIVALDAKDKIIEGTFATGTVEEMVAQLRRIGNTEKVLLNKALIFQFVIQNRGNASFTNIKVTSHFSIPKIDHGRWQPFENTVTWPTMATKKAIYISIPFTVGLNENFPEHIYFKIYGRYYDHEGEFKSKLFVIKWTKLSQSFKEL